MTQCDPKAPPCLKATPLSRTDWQEGRRRHSHTGPPRVSRSAPSLEILNAFWTRALLFQHALGPQFMELVPVAVALACVWQEWHDPRQKGPSRPQAQSAEDAHPRHVLHGQQSLLGRWRPEPPLFPLETVKGGPQAKEGTGGQAWDRVMGKLPLKRWHLGWRMQGAERSKRAFLGQGAAGPKGLGLVQAGRLSRFWRLLPHSCYHGRGSFNHRRVSPSSRAWEAKIKVPANPISTKGLLPCLPSWCVFGGLRTFSSYKGTNPILGAPPSWPHLKWMSPKVPTSKCHCRGGQGFSLWYLRQAQTFNHSTGYDFFF